MTKENCTVKHGEDKDIRILLNRLGVSIFNNFNYVDIVLLSYYLNVQ